MAWEKRPKLVRQDEPPSEGIGTLIRRHSTVSPTKYLILSSKVHGFWSHWTGSYTCACTRRTDEHCDGCVKKWGRKWKGYTHCINLSTNQPLLLEITEYVAKSIRSQTLGESSLRGMILELRKTSPAKHAHFRVQMFPRSSEALALPEEIDPEEDVAKLWGSVPQRTAAPANRLNGSSSKTY